MLPNDSANTVPAPPAPPFCVVPYNVFPPRNNSANEEAPSLLVERLPLVGVNAEEKLQQIPQGGYCKHCGNLNSRLSSLTANSAGGIHSGPNSARRGQGTLSPFTEALFPSGRLECPIRIPLDQSIRTTWIFCASNQTSVSRARSSQMNSISRLSSTWNSYTTGRHSVVPDTARMGRPPAIVNPARIP